MRFPNPKNILNEAILHTIIHAIANISDPILFYELSWDGRKYTRQDTMGKRGVVTFDENIIVGVFSDIKSERFVAKDGDFIEWKHYFNGASKQFLDLAREEATMYMLERHNNEVIPVITTAFWGERQKITSKDNWQTFIQSGGQLIQTECQDLERMYDLFPRLSERRTQYAGTMSGGEQQMLVMARPRLLLLDEPSMGLAPILVDSVFDTIKQIKDEGTTVLLVEQNAHMALQIADRGYVLQSGEIVLSDTAKNLQNDPEVQKTYLGID